MAVLLTSSVLFAALAVFLYFNQKEFKTSPYKLSSPPELKGPLKVNTILRNAELLLKGKVMGPESLVVGENNTIYTGTWDGKLLKIVDGRIEKSLSIRSGAKKGICATYDGEPECGRPLGFRQLNKNEFIVAEAYSGIYIVNFDEDSIKPVFTSSHQIIDGHRCSFINDLDVLDNRTIFFTDSSFKWDRRRFLHDFLEGNSNGRVVSLDLNTGETEKLLSGLYFANGLQIHPDRKSILVSECSMARITRYYFAGYNRGKRVTFVENLPGFPDNIRLSRSGNTFLVGLAGVRHSEALVPFVDILGPVPWLRWILVQLIPERYLAKLFIMLSKKYGFVLELDLDGKIITSYQDPTGIVVPDVSQAIDDEKYIYLGSYHSDFIAKVLKKGF